MTVRRTAREIGTRTGPARLLRLTPSGAAERPVLVLGHGAGAGIEAADLTAVATGVAAAGFPVVLVEQPWRVAGGRIAPRPATLDLAWIDVLTGMRRSGLLVVGGRSAGARVACRTAVEVGAAAVVALAFPLHPPGRPERSRAEELAGVEVPVLVLQGTRDPFGTAAQVAVAAPGATVLPIPGGDHGLARVDLTAATAAVVAFLARTAE